MSTQNKTSCLDPAHAQAGDACLTVYYDGSCPLCTFEIDHYAAQQGGERLRFVDVSRAGANIGSDLAVQDAMARFHVRQRDGRLISGARAFTAIWQQLPRWRWAARLAKLPGVTMTLEGAYKLFLPFRPLLSRLAAVLGADASPDAGTGK
jgi:predicted DCC family thiol-disulfide oxidoreductase YuxK